MKISMGRISPKGTLPCHSIEKEDRKVSFPFPLSSAKQPTKRKNKDKLERKIKTHLPSRRVHSQSVPQLLLTNGPRRINLVTQDQEGDFRQFLDGEEGVQLGLGFVETFRVLRVDEEDDTVYFREVVLPKSAGCGEGAKTQSGGETRKERQGMSRGENETHLVDVLLDRKW